MKADHPFYPVAQLSIAGNRAEFGIPGSSLGDAVCQLRLVWGWVEGQLQPCILHEGVRYPHFHPASAADVYGKN